MQCGRDSEQSFSINYIAAGDSELVCLMLSASAVVSKTNGSTLEVQPFIWKVLVI
jgi:hypothetical protein